MPEVAAATETQPVVAPTAPPENQAPETPAVVAPPSDGKPPEQAPGAEPPKQADADDATRRTGTARFERRIAAATRRAAEERARREFLEKELSELRGKAAPSTPDSSAPRIEQFDDVQKYAEAHAEWKLKQHQRETTAKQQQERQAAFQAELQSAWDKAREAGEDKYDDWQEVVGEVKPVTPWAIAIARSPNAADVAYHLGKHIDEARRIAALSPDQQFFEIARISHTLAATPPPKPAASKAPAPISPVTATSSPGNDEIHDGMSYEELVRVRNKQLGRTKR